MPIWEAFILKLNEICFKNKTRLVKFVVNFPLNQSGKLFKRQFVGFSVYDTQRFCSVE